MIEEASAAILCARDLLRIAILTVIKCIDWLLMHLQQLISAISPSKPRATPPKIPSKKSKAYEEYLVRSGNAQDKTKMSYFPAFILKGLFWEQPQITDSFGKAKEIYKCYELFGNAIIGEVKTYLALRRKSCPNAAFNIKYLDKIFDNLLKAFCNGTVPAGPNNFESLFKGADGLTLLYRDSFMIWQIDETVFNIGLTYWHWARFLAAIRHHDSHLDLTTTMGPDGCFPLQCRDEVRSHLDLMSMENDPRPWWKKFLAPTFQKARWALDLLLILNHMESELSHDNRSANFPANFVIDTSNTSRREYSFALLLWYPRMVRLLTIKLLQKVTILFPDIYGPTAHRPRDDFKKTQLRWRPIKWINNHFRMLFTMVGFAVVVCVVAWRFGA